MAEGVSTRLQKELTQLQKDFDKMEAKLDAKLDVRFEKMAEKFQKDLQVGIQQGLASIIANLSNLIRQATQPSIETKSGKKGF